MNSTGIPISTRRRPLRTVWPEFFVDVALFEGEERSGLPLRTALVALWTCADREGRFKWAPKILKLQCLPHDNVDFEQVLVSLERSGHVRSYIVDGMKHGCVVNWARQAINAKERASELPPPPVPPAISTRRDHEVTALASKEDRDVIVPASRDDHDAKIATESAPAAPQEGKVPEGSSQASAEVTETSEELPREADASNAQQIDEPKQFTDGPSLTELLYEAADGKVEVGRSTVPIEQLIADGYDLELDILPVLRDRVAPLDYKLRNWHAEWVATAIRDSRDNRLGTTTTAKLAPTSQVKPSSPEPYEDSRFDWDELVAGWAVGNVTWDHGKLGQPPGHPACRVPKRVLIENGYGA